MKYLILSFILLSSIKSFSVIGHDDRFYIHGTKWADLLNGIVEVSGHCTGFVIEGDIIITAAHCFRENSYLNKNGKKVSYKLITKDSKIDYKKLKHIEVYFGDANFDPRDQSKKTHFNDINFLGEAKALFLGFNPIKKYRSILDEWTSKDYAFIKLEQEIPKNIKRFKIFNPDLLKDYKILKHPYSGNLSTAAYHGDNLKTKYQRMAHIGCKARDIKQYKKIWFEYTDCDLTDGASGAPIFYILRHKKTKKIELALTSISLFGSFAVKERAVDHDRNTKPLKKASPYRLAFSFRYYLNSFYEGSFQKSLLITNHKKFLSHLEKFKKNPSFFRNKKLAQLEKNKYLNKIWIYRNIIQKKSLEELKDFVTKDLVKLSGKYEGIDHSTDQELKKLSKDKNFKIKKEKRDYLNKVFNKDNPHSYEEMVFQYHEKFYPGKKRAKKFSLEKLIELEDKFERKEPDTYEDSINDKEKAKKLWKMYFSK